MINYPLFNLLKVCFIINKEFVKFRHQNIQLSSVLQIFTNYFEYLTNLKYFLVIVIPIISHPITIILYYKIRILISLIQDHSITQLSFDIYVFLTTFFPLIACLLD